MMDRTELTAICVTCGDSIADRQGLELALRAWPPAERRAHGQRSDLILVAAARDGQLAAACVARILPGRAAVVWLPQFANDPSSGAAIAQQIFERLEAELKQQGVHLVQALLSGNDRSGEAILAAD